MKSKINIGQKHQLIKLDPKKECKSYSGGEQEDRVALVIQALYLLIGDNRDKGVKCHSCANLRKLSELYYEQGPKAVGKSYQYYKRNRKAISASLYFNSHDFMFSPKMRKSSVTADPQAFSQQKNSWAKYLYL